MSAEPTTIDNIHGTESFLNSSQMTEENDAFADSQPYQNRRPTCW